MQQSAPNLFLLSGGGGEGLGGGGVWKLCECNPSVGVSLLPEFQSCLLDLKSNSRLLIALISVLQYVEHDAGH